MTNSSAMAEQFNSNSLFRHQVIVLFSLLWITINASGYQDFYSDLYQVQPHFSLVLLLIGPHFHWPLIVFCFGEEPIAYQFEWTVKNEPSGNDYRQEETRDGELTTGLYQVLLPDGRYQVPTLGPHHLGHCLLSVFNNQRTLLFHWMQTVKYRIDNDSGFLADVTYIGEAQDYPAGIKDYPAYPIYPYPYIPAYPSAYPSGSLTPTYSSPSPKSSNPSYPSEPVKTYPSYPSEPAKSYPSYPAEPAKTYPSYPSEPAKSYPSYPAEPAKTYPSYPSESAKSYPSYPSEPIKSSHASYPSGSDSPSYPSPASYPSYPTKSVKPSDNSYPTKPEGARPKINFMEYPPLEPATYESKSHQPEPTSPYTAPVMVSVTSKPKTVTEAPATVIKAQSQLIRLPQSLIKCRSGTGDGAFRQCRPCGLHFAAVPDRHEGVQGVQVAEQSQRPFPRSSRRRRHRLHPAGGHLLGTGETGQLRRRPSQRSLPETGQFGLSSSGIHPQSGLTSFFPPSHFP